MENSHASTYNVVGTIAHERGGRVPTLRDIAKHAGVSVSTASHALKGYSDISADTKVRVQETARLLNYHVNSAAQALVSSRSGLVGLVLFGEGLAHPFFHQVVHGAIGEVERSGGNVVASVISDGSYRESAFSRRAQERRLEGLVVMGLAEQSPEVRAIAESGIPAVFIDAVTHDGPQMAYVHSDNRTGTFLAATHLLELGHRRIAFVNAASDARIFADRAEGYLSALSDWGQPAGLPNAARVADDLAAGVWAADAAVEAGCTAVMCFSDRMALGVLEGLRLRGLRCPADVSVLGFDDIDMAGSFGPPLTTVRQHGQQMGKLAAAELIRVAGTRATQERCALRSHVVPTELVVRASTAPPGV